MVIDGHAHIQPSHGDEGEWDFPSTQAHVAYVQRLVYVLRKEARRLTDDLPMPDAWNALWVDELRGSWRGCRDVGARIEGDRFLWMVNGEWCYIPLIPARPYEELVALMDAVGIDKAVISMAERFHAYCRRAAQENPGRFILLAQIEEAEAYTEAGREELRTKITEWGFRGLYFNPLPGWDGYDTFHTERFDPLWDEVEALKIPVYCCGSFTAGDILSKLPLLAYWISRYPTIPRVITHGLPCEVLWNDGVVKIPDLLRELVNGYDIYLEVLPGAMKYYLHPHADDVIRALYHTFGPSKLIWGTEFIKSATAQPFTAQHYYQLYHYWEEHHPFIPRDDLALIRGGNLQRLFRL